MFTPRGVIEAPNSAEATARYWAWRASQGGTPEADALIRSKMYLTDPYRRDGELITTYDDPDQKRLADVIVNTYGRPSTEAGRLALHHALLEDLRYGLQEVPPKPYGVLYQTDYGPTGRMAEALRGHDASGLPTKTTTSTLPGFAYVQELGQPIRVIHGDFATAQEYLMGLAMSYLRPEEIVPLTAGNV